MKFSKLNKEMIVQRHSLKPKTNWNFKVLFGLIMNIIKHLNSLLVFFLIQQEPWHCNIMADKGLTLFDE